MGNFNEHTWGESMSLVSNARIQARLEREERWRRSLIGGTGG